MRTLGVRHSHWRAICVDGLTPAEAAARFEYAPGTVRNLYASFRKNPGRAFFDAVLPRPRRPAPEPAPSDRLILDLRQDQHLSVLEIADRLTAEGRPVSKSLVANVLQRHGISKLARRTLGSAHRAQLTPLWLAAAHDQGLPRGDDFDLDFHTIPYHGTEQVLEKHYLSKRSRRQRGVLAFLARDVTARAFTYVNATVHKEDQAAEILAFATTCRERTGAYLLYSTIFRSACLTLGRRDSTARKK